MRRLLPKINPPAESPSEADAAVQELPLEPAVSIPESPVKGQIKAAADLAESPVEPERRAKPLPELPLCFMLSHVEPDGPVRLDGVKLALTELMGLELDAPKLGAFAGLLNACDFPLQLLVRQHPPDLERMRRELEDVQPVDLPDQTREAARSQRRLLAELESREGILDRRFYAVCEEEHAQELRGLLARSGLSIHPLEGEPLQRLVIAAALGGSPARTTRDGPVEVQLNQRSIKLGGRLARSLHLSKWPRSLAPGFLQQLMATGAPMDIALHLGPIPSEQAARQLEWQKVRFESARSLSLRRGKTMSPEAEIALEDVSRLRDNVQRGRERLFHASLSLTLHADDPDTLDELTQRASAHFAAALGQLDPLPFRQREGLLSTQPLSLNAVAHWRTLDTSSVARCFPFSPPDLDTRSGALYGIDMRACAPIVYDPWDGTHLNANTAVLARSGSGKSFATKLGVLRGLCRGVVGYVIDPEGEYADMARSAGGRVLSPGVAGQGMNPFVLDRSDPEELLQRIGSLRRLIDVMVGERLSAERRAALDHALASYYARPSGRTGFRDFYRFLEGDDPEGLAKLLRPFASGSLRHLLSDEGDDLLHNEALVTVFDLRLLEPELRPAAAMVCTETVWAAAARDPRPRLLVVDEVWSIMQHPEGAAFMVSMAKRARKHRLGLQFITQDVQDLLSEDHSRTITGHSGRALLQNAAFKLLLQQDAAAISTVADAFDLPEDLQRWLISCPRGDGLLLAKGERFPIRIEATPEETELIEWRPGRH
ncbi:MAG: ATP-binding protein [Chloroflexota bacterium]|nr:ATP-binding protein [Chloroflexota bacterium]